MFECLFSLFETLVFTSQKRKKKVIKRKSTLLNFLRLYLIELSGKEIFI